MRADAQSDVESFTVGPLRLGQILSRASVSLDGNGKRTSQADTRVVGAMVGDTAVALTAAGLTVAGTNQPLPALDGVRSALAAAGITVEFMPGQEQPTGVVAPTVRITQRQASGAQLVYLMGGASALAEGNSPARPTPDVQPTPGAVEPVPGSAGAEVGAGSAAPPSPGLTGPAEAVQAGSGPAVGSRTAGAGSLSGEAAPIPAAPEATPATAEGQSQEALSPPAPDSQAAQRLASKLLGLSADAGPLYAALAIGAVAGLLTVGAALFRRGAHR